MKYIIFYEDKAFQVDQFNLKKHYKPGMVVFDIEMEMYTVDGEDWEDIDYTKF